MTGGFFFAERPDRSAPDARLFWSADVDDSVVSVWAEPVSADDPDAFALAHLTGCASLARGEYGREHLVLSDGWRRLRFDVVEGTLLGGEVRLHSTSRGGSPSCPRAGRR